MFSREDSLPLSMGGNKKNNGITGNLKAVDKGVRVPAPIFFISPFFR
jgi:hypothetical protein